MATLSLQMDVDRLGTAVNDDVTVDRTTIAQKTIRHIDIIFTPFCREIQDEQILPNVFTMLLTCGRSTRVKWPKTTRTPYYIYAPYNACMFCCLLGADELDSEFSPFTVTNASTVATPMVSQPSFLARLKDLFL